MTADVGLSDKICGKIMHFKALFTLQKVEFYNKFIFFVRSAIISV